MSPGFETEQMLDTKGRRHIDSLKLGNSVGNCPSVANVILVTILSKVLSHMWLGQVEIWNLADVTC